MRRLDSFQTHRDIELYVGPGNSIGQEFVANHNNLAGIRFVLFNAQLGGNTPYHLELYNDEGVLLREQIFTESNVGWAYEFRFDFEPIVDSANHRYRIMIIHGGDTENNLVTAVNANRVYSTPLLFDELGSVEKGFIGVSYAKTDRYESGSALLNDQKIPGDLHFETYYSTSMTQFVRDIPRDIAARLSANPQFMIIYGLLLLGLLGLIYMRIRKVMKA